MVRLLFTQYLIDKFRELYIGSIFVQRNGFWLECQARLKIVRIGVDGGKLISV